MLSRRGFLQEVVGISGGIVFGGQLAALAGNPSTDGEVADASPIDRSLGETFPDHFFGDNPEVLHPILWNKDLANQKPVSSEKTSIVIVGGGIAGLTSAYQLRKFKPILLEADGRFGGQSKGQSWKGLDYGLGAAYLCVPDAGSPIEKLLRDLKLTGKYRERPVEDIVEIGGELEKKFWTKHGAAKAYFESVLNDEKKFPEMPSYEQKTRAIARELDRKTFFDHLRDVLGSDFTPALQSYVEYYSWSAFAGSSREISAAAGMNFLAGEFGRTAAFPGGNAAISEAIYRAALPRALLRAGSPVVSVKHVGKEVEVLWSDPQRKLRKIVAKAVIMACPKFIAKRLLNEIPAERRAIIDAMEYRSYVVANIILKKPAPFSFYDLLFLGNPERQIASTAAGASEKGFTDCVLANYASHSTPQNAVLTCYRAYPHSNARYALLDPGIRAKLEKEFRDQAINNVLPLLKMGESDIVGIRLARWGHPMAVPKQGVYQKAELSEPFGNIFFANQDSWYLPAFETAANEALHWSKAVERRLA